MTLLVFRKEGLYDSQLHIIEWLGFSGKGKKAVREPVRYDIWLLDNTGIPLEKKKKTHTTPLSVDENARLDYKMHHN